MIVPRLPGSRTCSRATSTPSRGISTSGVKRCSKTPNTVCGFSRREIFSRMAGVTSMTSRARAAARSRAEWPADLPANIRIAGAKPRSTASVTIFSPSARKRPLSSRALRKCRARTCLTVSLASEVTVFTTRSSGRRTTGPRRGRRLPPRDTAHPSRWFRPVRRGRRQSDGRGRDRSAARNRR